MADPFDTPGYRFAVNNFPGDGSTTDWNIDFAGRTPGYISIDHVRAALIDDTTGEETPVLLGPANFILPTRIRVTPAVPAGVTLRVWRDTPKDLPMLDYTDGALMIERNLDTSNEQNIYAIAEMVDRFADSLDDVREFTEVVLDRLADVEEQAQEAYDISNTAISTANTALANSVAAVNTANDALAGVAGAEQAAIEATEAADNANAAAVVATNAANAANQAAQDATDTAALAVSIAQNAEDVANGIAGTAQEALDTAQEALDLAEDAVGVAADLPVKDDITKGVAVAGYLMDAAGAVGTDQATVNRERVSVTRWFTAAQIADVISQTGALNVHAAVQAALDWAGSIGGIDIHLPAGRYRIDGTLNMYSNTGLTGDGAATVLDYTNSVEGAAIAFTGTVGDEIALATAATSNSISVSLVDDHGAAVGDWYLVRSQRNALSKAAGEWQLGLPTGSFNASYFTEPVQVKNVISSTSFGFRPALIFPDYLPNNASEPATSVLDCATTSGSATVTLNSGDTSSLMSGQQVTGAGIPANTRIQLILSSTSILLSANATATAASVSLTFPAYSRASSTVRKVNWVENVCVRNLKIIGGLATSVVSSYAKDCVVENVTWDMGLNTGACVSWTRSMRCEARYCAVTHAPRADDESTPAYNTFKVTNGWYCGFTRCKSTNGTQPFDITYTNNGNPSLFTWVNYCEIINSSGTPFTTHSGSYGFVAKGNQCSGCWFGPSLRTRRTILVGNTFQGMGRTKPDGSTFTYGVRLSDGFAIDSIVANNFIDNFDQAVVVADYLPGGQGLVDQRTLITDNKISRSTYGVWLVHDGAYATGVHCNVAVKNNLFTDVSLYGVRIQSYVNGVEVSGNTFVGPMTFPTSDVYGIYVHPNSTRHVVRDNTFLNLGSNAVPVYFGGITDTTTFPWATIQSANGHQTGGNVVLGPRSNSFVGNSYRDTKTVGDPVRGWAVGADMVSVIERASGASLVLCTDPSSSNSLVFADTDSATQARISYNHSTDVMSLTANGQVVNLGAGYMRPGTNAQKSMGDSSFRWTAVYANNVVLNPPSSATPAANGDMTFELTSNTSLTVKVRGSDGTTRSHALALAEAPQSWQTVSRLIGNNYTNTTNRPILVAMQVSSSANPGTCYLTVDGTVVSRATVAESGLLLGVNATVPPGSVYSFGASGVDPSSYVFKEYR